MSWNVICNVIIPNYITKFFFQLIRTTNKKVLFLMQFSVHPFVAYCSCCIHLVVCSKSDIVGHDGITSKILKLGGDVLKVPLTYIVNTSIKNSEYPAYWKISKMIALYKKGSRYEMKNYRPLSLLCVAGMILERVIAIQIEDYFESNNLLGSFQFGFRK